MWGLHWVKGQALNPRPGVQGGPHGPVATLKPKVVEFSCPAELGCWARRNSNDRSISGICGGGLRGQRFPSVLPIRESLPA